MLDIKEKNIVEIFYSKAEKLSDKPFLSWKENGTWKSNSWSEIRTKSHNMALGLISLGVKPHDHVAIFAPNRPEWAISDLAILSAAAADIPIYPTNSSKEAEYILNDSDSKIVIVATRDHLDRVLKIRGNLSKLEYIITMDDIPGVYEDETILPFEKIQILGLEYEDKSELDRRMKSVEIEDIATIIYTSGTTGPPKGVMLSHKNFLANTYQAFLSHEGLFEWGEKTLSFLPLSHVLERTAGWYLAIMGGATIHYAENPDTVMDNMKEIRPNFVISVPRLFEKIYSGIHEKVGKASSSKQKLFKWSVSTGKQAANYITQNKTMPIFLSAQHRVAKALVLDKIREALGLENIKVFVSGGGPLSKEINHFFHAIGVTIHEGYGLTETTPVLTVNTFEDLRFGYVGKSVLDTSIKIAKDGEILAKGPQIMKGYYNNPDATAEAFTSDGWFKTGDIGRIDDGLLKITDRKKDLIITAGGKNISPQNIENAMITDRYVENIVAIGDGRPYITALIVPDFPALEEWAEKNGVSFSDYDNLVKKPEVLKLFDEHIKDLNEQFARVEQLKKFRLIDHSFSQETGELTPTMKLKRKIINEKYRDMIESMYR